MEKLILAGLLVLATAFTATANTVDVLAGAFDMWAPAVIGGNGYQFNRLGALDLSAPMPDDFISGNSAIGLDTGAFPPFDIWTSAAPHLSLTGSDLSGWSFSIHGTNDEGEVYHILFYQGATNVPTVDNGDGSWTMTWHSPFVGGPFDGYTGYWQLQTTAPVPEPSSVLLIGSGLAGLAGLARGRRRGH